MRPMPSKDDVLTALDRIIDPKTGRGLVASGRVQGLVVADDRAGFALDVPAADAALYAPVRDAAEAALRALPGMARTSVVLTSETPPVAPRRTASLSPQAMDQTRPRAPVPTERPAHVRKVLAVAGGKGGVGKSTVTVNLAAALAARGRSVGIVDADVHGFSVPGLLGIDRSPTQVGDMILPPVVEVPEAARQDTGRAGVLKVISIGMFVDPDQPVAWRGPMLHRAVEQFLTDVHFGDLDHLFLDLPPGTGDVAISVAQLLPTAEVLVVSTPQQAAVEVAERSGALAVQTGQTVAGVVENMAGMPMPDGSVLELFGAGGGARIAESLTRRLGYEVPLLGGVPLDVALREGGDAGRPVVWSAPDSPAAAALRSVADVLGSRPLGLAGRPLGLGPR